MPIGWLYITYHLLREPETAIDWSQEVLNQKGVSSNSGVSKMTPDPKLQAISEGEIPDNSRYICIKFDSPRKFVPWLMTPDISIYISTHFQNWTSCQDLAWQTWVEVKSQKYSIQPRNLTWIPKNAIFKKDIHFPHHHFGYPAVSFQGCNHLASRWTQNL